MEMKRNEKNQRKSYDFHKIQKNIKVEHRWENSSNCSEEIIIV